MLKWADIVALADGGNPAPPRKVHKTSEQWRAQLDAEQYRVTRERGTERPHSSAMCAVFEPGHWECVCCGTQLFDSETKFDSGTGWPSFSGPVADDVIAYSLDVSHGMQRIEVCCNVCDAHLGHVFPDGPAPSGLRFCINAVALRKTSDA